MLLFYKGVLRPAGDVLQRCAFGKVPECVHSPSCSTYGAQMILRYGILRGSLLGVKRILSCWGILRRKGNLWR